MLKYPLNEIISKYIAKFNEEIIHLNKIYTFELKLPYSISSHPKLTIRMGRMIGCAMDKKNSLLIISPEAHDKEFLEVVIVREILVILLSELIILNQKIEDFIVFWYDLALLLANFYLGNRFNAFIRKILESSTISFLNFQDGTKFYCSEKIVAVLSDFLRILSSEEIEILILNVFNILKILKKYNIRLSIREFTIACDALIDIFSSKNLYEYLKSLEEVKNLEFIKNIFEKALEIDRSSVKDEFLSLCFKILTKTPEKEKYLSFLKENLSEYLKDEIIKKEIVNLKILTCDVLTH
ncbi:MAG: hypothetical protein JW891_09440 [Candidatus Lokiarchaeota archaeon]|nr:hypothetical protein [Candidatus Lokiarchaeota archaeon]